MTTPPWFVPLCALFFIKAMSAVKVCGIFFRDMEGSIGLQASLVGTVFVIPPSVAHIICVGFGFIYLPTVIDLKRNSSNFASFMPIAAIGTYAGIVTCPGIVELYLRNYGLHAAYCLFGARLWNIIPTGLLLSDKGENEHVPHKSTVNSVIHKEQSVLNMATTTEPGLEHKGGLKQTLLQVQDYTGRVFTIFTDTLYALKDQYDIFRDTVFVLFFIISNMRKFISESWILFLIPYSQEIGLDKTSAVIVGSVGGIGGIIGRLVAAVSFSENCSLPPLTMFALYYFMIALVFAAFERVGNILYLSACAFLGGLFISAHTGMISGLILELFGHKDFVRAFAVIDFGCGVFSLLSGYLTGGIYDLTGSFQALFRVSALFSFISGVIVVLIIIMKRN